MTHPKFPSIKIFNLFTTILIFVGLLFIGLSSSSESINLGNDQSLFFRKQVVWIVVGYFFFIIGRYLNLNLIRRFSLILFLFSIFLLILVLIPNIGITSLGASRRIDLGIFGIQPSEIVKLTAIIFFANIFSQKILNHLKYLALYLVPALILIILEPNLSTTVLLATIIISLFYLSGGNIITIFFISFLAIGTSLLLIYVSPYRKARLSANYHSDQLILSIGSGGLTGKGLGNSEQKYSFLPKIPTDSILAIIGEETGFAGIFLLTLIYFFIISYIFKLSMLIVDPFESLLVSGIGLWITFQTLINYAAISGIIPLTGQPLPLVSYGGSSLTTLLFSFGLIGNIQKRTLLLYSHSHDSSKDNRHYRSSSHSRHRTGSSIKK